MNNNPPFWIMLAHEGETTDGRYISAETLIALAESYSPDIYSARVYKSPSQSITVGGLLSELRGEMLAAKTEIHNDTTYLYGLIAPTKYWFSVLSEDELASVTIYPTICCVHKTSFTEKPYIIEVATTTAPLFPGIEPLNKHMVKS
ncbi:GPO family capsid scaffolding protein [Serratia fonticola]|uniref:GPO family capsid scaffolding protein n=1 Tax=Serratia fonticola TaxID=47917 RepID=UPI001645D455|nr:GPO family capsid scaffolding protein [Serratia fonticola]MBC3250945.1 GPO family capsid scaffolding protein [Serratia fonticola]